MVKILALLQVSVRPGLAIPLRLHRGSPHEAVLLRAVPEFGASKREAFHFVATRWGPASLPVQTWQGRIRWWAFPQQCNLQAKPSLRAAQRFACGGVLSWFCSS